MVPEGWRSTALTPGHLLSSRFCPPVLGRPELRGIKTNAQPAPATSPCRSAHLLVMFLGEEMVGCHVSVSGHVMPLPALVFTRITNLPLTSGGAARPTAPTVRVLGKSLAHPAHCFPAVRASKTGPPRNGGLWPPRAPREVSNQPPPSACGLVRRIRPRQTEMTVSLRGLPRFSKGHPPPLPPIQGKPFLTESRKGVVHLAPPRRDVESPLQGR